MKDILLALSVIFLFSGIAKSQEGKDTYTDFSAEVKLDYRWFPEDGLYEGQKKSYFSFAFEPEYLVEWQGGKYTLKATGFGRIDQHDSRRTHFDVRELYWQMVKGNWELSLGAKKIFWGKTESAHLVDIINQTDVVESFDGEQKLGQPMIHYSYLTNVGTFDLFYLPYFRTRQFPGRKGRLRFPVILDGSEIEFESSADEFQPSFAGRWSHYVGVLDFGVSHFYGVGREPIVTDFSTFDLIYGTINQTGIDIQATTGPALWKFEAIKRFNDFQDMFATVAGLEYTFYNIRNSGIDIGVLGEYLYDDRDDLTFSGLQNDVFVGSRIAFNDSQDSDILFGAIFDLERTTKIFSIEAGRRIGSSWNIDVESRIFSNVDFDPPESLLFLRNDSFLQFSITKYL